MPKTGIRKQGAPVEVSEGALRTIVEMHRKGRGYDPISETTGFSRWTVAKKLYEMVVGLYKEGKRYREISDETGYSLDKVQTILEQAGMPPHPSAGPRVGESSEIGRRPRASMEIDTQAIPESEEEESGDSDDRGPNRECAAGSPSQETQEERAVSHAPVRSSRRKDSREQMPATVFANQIAIAQEEANRYAEQARDYADRLYKMWEEVQYLAEVEKALADAKSAIQVMGRRLEGYEQEKEKVRQEALNRAMAVSSESSRYR